MLEWAQENYEVDIDPANKDEVRLALGYGWWKYAPDVAETLLKNRVSPGMQMASGVFRWKPWTINILTGVDPTAMDYIVILGIAEQWKKFGINVVLNPNTAESYSITRW